MQQDITHKTLLHINVHMTADTKTSIGFVISPRLLQIVRNKDSYYLDTVMDSKDSVIAHDRLNEMLSAMGYANSMVAGLLLTSRHPERKKRFDEIIDSTVSEIADIPYGDVVELANKTLESYASKIGDWLVEFEADHEQIFNELAQELEQYGISVVTDKTFQGVPCAISLSLILIDSNAYGSKMITTRDMMVEHPMERITYATISEGE